MTPDPHDEPCAVRRVTEGRDFFRIEYPRCIPAVVRLVPWRFEVRQEETQIERVGLFEGHGLVHAVTRRLMRDWQPDLNRPVFPDIHRWMRERVRRRVAALVGAQRRRLLETVPAEVRDVQRAIFAATAGSAELAEGEALYRHSYLVRDVVRFRAAAIAVRNVADLVGSRARRLAASLEGDAPQGGGGAAPSEPELLAALADWKALFAPTGRSGRSLRRTLMNLPCVRPAWLVCALVNFELQRPVTDLLQLRVLLSRASLAPYGGDAVRDRHLELLQFATPGEVRRMFDELGAYLGRRLRPHLFEDITTAVRFLIDAQQRAGRLSGLVRRSLDWHRMAPRRRLAELGLPPEVTEETPVAVPPAELPADARIRFLATVGSILAEGQNMGHCIATRVPRALAGESYLFHVARLSRRGVLEEASVELDLHGRVVEARGPYNTVNGASRWGARRLGEWAARLRRTGGWRESRLVELTALGRTRRAHACLDLVACYDTPEHAERFANLTLVCVPPAGNL